VRISSYSLSIRSEMKRLRHLHNRTGPTPSDRKPVRSCPRCRSPWAANANESTHPNRYSTCSRLGSSYPFRPRRRIERPECDLPGACRCRQDARWQRPSGTGSLGKSGSSTRLSRRGAGSARRAGPRFPSARMFPAASASDGLAATPDAHRLLRIAVQRLAAAGVPRAGEQLVKRAFEHRMSKFTRLIAKVSLDRIEPVAEKTLRRLDFGVRQTRRGAIAPWRDLGLRSNAEIACWTKDYTAFIFQPLR
jgi:hypothetical protein